jgi:hypothetical protein
MKSFQTLRERLFSLFLMTICFLVAPVSANIIIMLLIGESLPFIANMLLNLYFAVGVLGFVRPDPVDLRTLIQGLRTCVIWPYLAWKRIGAVYATPTDRRRTVFVNDVAVGDISDVDWCAIRLDVLRDPRIHIKQVLSIIRMCSLVVSHLVLVIPLIAFWGIVCVAVFSPDEYSVLIGLLQQGPEAIEAIVRYMAWLYGLSLMVLVSIGFAFGRYQFGFVDHFADARAKLVRQRLNVA